MLAAWLNHLRKFLGGSQTWRRTKKNRPNARLYLELLEERAVPTVSPFVLDSTNRLFAANDATGQTYTNTGAFGVQLSVGEVTGGGQFAAFRDGNNRVYLFNGNNNIITTTNAFAVDIVSGRGQVFLRDGNNQVVRLALGAALNGDGTFMTTSTATAAFALQMEVGYDTTTAQDFLVFRAGSNSVHAIEIVGGVPVYGTTGAFAIDLEAGNEKDTFIRDGNNQVHVLTINTATAAGITYQPILTTVAFALEMSVGRGSPIGDDFMVYRAGDNSVNYLRYAPGAPSTVTYVSIPGTFAIQVLAGANDIFFRDGSNRVYYSQQNVDGTTVVTTMTNVFAAQLRNTRWSSVALPVDQLSILDGAGRLYVSQNNAGGDAIASFFDTGMFANDVQGFTKNP